MKRKLLILSALCLCLTAGCGKKEKTEVSTEAVTEETTEEEIDLSAYTSINAVNGFTFVVRNSDLTDNYTFNPSILNTHQSPFFYYLGGWSDANDNIQYYEPVDLPPIDNPLLFATGNVYVYYGDNFSYDINTDGVFTVSISIVKSADDFIKVLNSIGIDNASNILYANDDSFSYQRDGNTFICKANITYKSRLGKDFKGTAVMYETDAGQSYLVAGGEDFTKEDMKTISDKFVLCDNVSNILTYYPDTSSITYDLGGRAITGDFPSFFKIDTSIGGWYWSDRCGFPDLFCANEYLRTAVLGTVYYMPIENIDTDTFLATYSPYLYNPYVADTKSELRDADGHTWERYNFNNSSEVSGLSHTVLYVYVEGNYVYLFGLYFDNSLKIDYSPYMDNAISTVHITQGLSEPYSKSSDFFYLNLGMEIPTEEVATSTDALPEVEEGQEQENIEGEPVSDNSQTPTINDQDPTSNMSDAELQQYILEQEGYGQ